MLRTRSAVSLSLPLALLLGCSERPGSADPQEPASEPARAADLVQVAGQQHALPGAAQELAVTHLLGLYSQFGDEADRAGFGRIFTADAHIEIDGATLTVEQHVDQRVARATRLRQAGQQPRRLFASPVLSAVGGDELRVRGYFTDLVGQPAGDRDPRILAIGRFQATVLRGRDEDWRIHDWREWSDQVTEPVLPVAELDAVEAIEPGEIPIDGRQWRLQALLGEPLAEELPVPTLVLDGAADRAFGFAGVHAFGGRIRLDEETLRFMAVIAPGAEEPEEAVALQETYLDMLGRVRAWQFDERAARLTLLDQESEPLAVYSAVD